MTPRLLAALKEHKAAFRLGGSPWLFFHTTTRRHHTRGERLHSLLHSFQNAVARAELPTGVRPYDLRHIAITGWARRYPAADVHYMAGHSFYKTEGYITIKAADVKAYACAEPDLAGEKTG